MSDSLRLAAALAGGVLGDRFFEIRVDSNLWEIYQAGLQGETLPWEATPRHWQRNWRGAPWHVLQSVAA